jgi:hypothetical protein
MCTSTPVQVEKVLPSDGSTNNNVRLSLHRQSTTKPDTQNKFLSTIAQYQPRTGKPEIPVFPTSQSKESPTSSSVPPTLPNRHPVEPNNHHRLNKYEINKSKNKQIFIPNNCQPINESNNNNSNTLQVIKRQKQIIIILHPLTIKKNKAINHPTHKRNPKRHTNHSDKTTTSPATHQSQTKINTTSTHPTPTHKTPQLKRYPNIAATASSVEVIPVAPHIIENCNPKDNISYTFDSNINDIHTRTIHPSTSSIAVPSYKSVTTNATPTYHQSPSTISSHTQHRNKTVKINNCINPNKERISPKHKAFSPRPKSNREQHLNSINQTNNNISNRSRHSLSSYIKPLIIFSPNQAKQKLQHLLKRIRIQTYEHHQQQSQPIEPTANQLRTRNLSNNYYYPLRNYDTDLNNESQHIHPNVTALNFNEPIESNQTPTMPTININNQSNNTKQPFLLTPSSKAFNNRTTKNDWQQVTHHKVNKPQPDPFGYRIPNAAPYDIPPSPHTTPAIDILPTISQPLKLIIAGPVEWATGNASPGKPIFKPSRILLAMLNAAQHFCPEARLGNVFNDPSIPDIINETNLNGSEEQEKQFIFNARIRTDKFYGQILLRSNIDIASMKKHPRFHGWTTRERIVIKSQHHSGAAYRNIGFFTRIPNRTPQDVNQTKIIKHYLPPETPAFMLCTQPYKSPDPEPRATRVLMVQCEQSNQATLTKILEDNHAVYHGTFFAFEDLSKLHASTHQDILYDHEEFTYQYTSMSIQGFQHDSEHIIIPNLTQPRDESDNDKNGSIDESDDMLDENNPHDNTDEPDPTNETKLDMPTTPLDEEQTITEYMQSNFVDENNEPLFLRMGPIIQGAREVVIQKTQYNVVRELLKTLIGTLYQTLPRDVSEACLDLAIAKQQIEEMAQHDPNVNFTEQYFQRKNFTPNHNNTSIQPSNENETTTKRTRTEFEQPPIITKHNQTKNVATTATTPTTIAPGPTITNDAIENLIEKKIQQIMSTTITKSDLQILNDTNAKHFNELYQTIKTNDENSKQAYADLFTTAKVNKAIHEKQQQDLLIIMSQRQAETNKATESRLNNIETTLAAKMNEMMLVMQQCFPQTLQQSNSQSTNAPPSDTLPSEHTDSSMQTNQ